MKKRTMALLLVGLMVMALLPAAAFAREITDIQVIPGENGAVVHWAHVDNSEKAVVTSAAFPGRQWERENLYLSIRFDRRGLTLDDVGALTDAPFTLSLYDADNNLLATGTFTVTTVENTAITSMKISEVVDGSCTVTVEWEPEANAWPPSYSQVKWRVAGSNAAWQKSDIIREESYTVTISGLQNHVTYEVAAEMVTYRLICHDSITGANRWTNELPFDYVVKTVTPGGPAPLVPQVIVPPQRLPENIEPEEVPDVDVPEIDSDVAEDTADATLEEEIAGELPAEGIEEEILVPETGDAAASAALLLVLLAAAALAARKRLHD